MLRLVLAALSVALAGAKVTITVSGGSFSPPYYNFDPPITELTEGETYEFVDGGVAAAHPFRIKGEKDDAPSDYYEPVGGNFDGSGGTITFEAVHPIKRAIWWCDNHPSMTGTLEIPEPVGIDCNERCLTRDACDADSDSCGGVVWASSPF